MCEIQEYKAPEWVTPQGVSRKLRIISKRGLPSLFNAKRLTLTVNRDNFDDEPQALRAMLDQFPKFIRRISNAYQQQFKKEFPPYVMWIEFHADGWAHFHMDWLCRHRLDLEWWCNDADYYFSKLDTSSGSVGLLMRAWELGHVHIKTINRKQDNYAFKYAFKPEGDTDPNQDYSLPSWFMDYTWIDLVPAKTWDDKAKFIHFRDAQGNYKFDSNGDPVGKFKGAVVTAKDDDGKVIKVEKLRSFRRLRMWRPSQGFYTEQLEKKPASKPPVTCELPTTVRKAFQDYARKVVVVARDVEGKYLKSAVVLLDRLAGEVQQIAYSHSLRGLTFPTVFGGIHVPSDFWGHFINKNNTNELCKIQKLLNLDQLTPQTQWATSDNSPILVPF